jgi:hypothetical protein
MHVGKRQSKEFSFQLATFTGKIWAERTKT